MQGDVSRLWLTGPGEPFNRAKCFELLINICDELHTQDTEFIEQNSDMKRFGTDPAAASVVRPSKILDSM